MGTPYSVRPVHSRSLSEADNVASLMRKIRSPCSVLNRHAPKTVLDLAGMSLGWLRELLRQERALKGRHAASKPEVDETIEIKSEDEDAIVYEDPRPVKPSKRE